MRKSLWGGQKPNHIPDCWQSWRNRSWYCEDDSPWPWKKETKENECGKYKALSSCSMSSCLHTPLDLQEKKQVANLTWFPDTIGGRTFRCRGFWRSIWRQIAADAAVVPRLPPASSCCTAASSRPCSMAAPNCWSTRDPHLLRQQRRMRPSWRRLKISSINVFLFFRHWRWKQHSFTSVCSPCFRVSGSFWNNANKVKLMNYRNQWETANHIWKPLAHKAISYIQSNHQQTVCTPKTIWRKHDPHMY